MTLVGNGRRHSFINVQLIVAGLAMVAIGGCKQAPPPANVAPAPAGSMDTPIVIMGGSIHFRAALKAAEWVACPNTTNTCYRALFNDEPNMVNYQFVDETFTKHQTAVSSVADGWEIDVVDANPGNINAQKQMLYGVLVCAQSSNFTSCDNTQIKPSAQFIYVIAVGGSFDSPVGPGNYNNRIEYHDASGNKHYDYISNIQLNAHGATGGTTQPCTDNACSLILSN